MVGALPPEILQHILSSLSINDESAKLLTRFSAASRSFFAVARDPILWKPFYIGKYKHADAASDKNRCSRLGDDWCSLYYERRKLDHLALEEVRRMTEERDSETQLLMARKIVENGMDIYDALKNDAGVQTTGIIGTHAEDIELSGHVDRELTRKVWSHRLLCIITARNALRRWSKLKRYLAGEEASPLPYEEAFSCLSSFHGIFAEDILKHTHALCDDLKDTLELNKDVTLDISNPGFDINKLCTEIIAFMRCKGFERSQVHDFYNVENNFPHSFLFTHKRAHPLSHIFIFITLINRFGVQAMPLLVGATVVVIVSENLVIDVYRGEITQLSPPTVADLGDKERRASITKTILLRAAKQILTAIDSRRISRNPYIERAYVAARCIQMLFLPHPFSTLEREISHWDAHYQDLMFIERELIVAECYSPAPHM